MVATVTIRFEGREVTEQGATLLDAAWKAAEVFAAPTETHSYRDVWCDRMPDGSAVWYRQGRIGPIAMHGADDPSSIHVSPCDLLCWACMTNLPHSKRLHAETVFGWRDRNWDQCSPWG